MSLLERRRLEARKIVPFRSRRPVPKPKGKKTSKSPTKNEKPVIKEKKTSRRA